eukprot:793909-Prymnesium_polylepis.2
MINVSSEQVEPGCLHTCRVPGCAHRGQAGPCVTKVWPHTVSVLSTNGSDVCSRLFVCGALDVGSAALFSLPWFLEDLEC